MAGRRELLVYAYFVNVNAKYIDDVLEVVLGVLHIVGVNDVFL